MKKFILFLLMFVSIQFLSANTVGLYINKTNIASEYNYKNVIDIMNKYHDKYGNKDYIDLNETYYTIIYYAQKYDIDLSYALSFFAIESGFSYVCKSSYSAMGMGQVTEIALKEFNSWYNKNIPLSYMNDETYYDYNIMVSLGYLRIMWDKYTIIKSGEDLMKAYNIGVGNLINIKKGITTKWKIIDDKKVDYWKWASDKYAEKFIECYNNFQKCKKY